MAATASTASVLAIRLMVRASFHTERPVQSCRAGLRTLHAASARMATHRSA
ncbi:Uncharacterised protein [Bordetella pertussis]|nr:Uncharacterised protein [Bordetella pertussis]